MNEGESPLVNLGTEMRSYPLLCGNLDQNILLKYIYVCVYSSIIYVIFICIFTQCMYRFIYICDVYNCLMAHNNVLIIFLFYD